MSRLDKQPRRRKGVPSADKQVKTTLNSHSWEFHKNTKLLNHKAYAENLAQTCTGSVFVPSVPVSTYESCLVDSFLMASFLPLWFLQSFLSVFCWVPLALSSVWLWVSASAPISCWRKPLWWGVSKALIRVKRISLGIISLQNRKSFSPNPYPIVFFFFFSFFLN